jgi:hypothetical protein
VKGDVVIGIYEVLNQTSMVVQTKFRNSRSCANESGIILVMERFFCVLMRMMYSSPTKGFISAVFSSFRCLWLQATLV